ncbi:diguanylate cyclase domain-containing protein [Pseudomonas chlororaphis]
MTASFGVACWQRELDVQTLLRQADEATYSAKQEGRNRVRMAVR